MPSLVTQKKPAPVSQKPNTKNISQTSNQKVQVNPKTAQQKNLQQKANKPSHDAVHQEELSVDLLRERRYLWTARAFAIVSAVALCANLVLIIAIMRLFPLQRTEPFLLSFQSSDKQFATIRRLPKDMSTEEVLSEALIRQYVMLRNTMVADLEEMKTRWGEDGPVRWMSSNKVFKIFSDAKKDWLERIRIDGLTREVRIESVVRTPTPNIWFVDIMTKDMLPESDQPETQSWRIIVEIDYFYREKRIITYSDRLQNPLGFTIVNYSIQSQLSK
ncbi:MAG: VirB8/TrbF family protein [Alphaproteobacteria bacterium]|nr:VirB8/TrbF family protein [Alphaproteobacteria bacterium]